MLNIKMYFSFLVPSLQKVILNMLQKPIHMCQHLSFFLNIRLKICFCAELVCNSATSTWNGQMQQKWVMLFVALASSKSEKQRKC